MPANTKDPAFHARVSQGHVENFYRKIAAAVNDQDLDNILQTLNVAVERNMINSDDCNTLIETLNARRSNLFA